MGRRLLLRFGRGANQKAHGGTEAQCKGRHEPGELRFGRFEMRLRGSKGCKTRHSGPSLSLTASSAESSRKGRPLRSCNAWAESGLKSPPVERCST